MNSSVFHFLHIILSLFWSRFTANGALAAMLAGFLGVPLFKFGATALPTVGPAFAALSELPPAFVLSALVGVAVSLSHPPEHATREFDKKPELGGL